MDTSAYTPVAGVGLSKDGGMLSKIWQNNWPIGTGENSDKVGFGSNEVNPIKNNQSDDFNRSMMR